MPTMTHQKRYIVEQACAAHCEYQGSNKDWVGVLVHVVDAQADPTAQEAPDAATWMFLSVYGRSGGTLQGGEPAPLTTRASAQAFYRAKVREKLDRHHYYEIGADPFLKAFKLPLEMPTPQRVDQSRPAPLPESAASRSRPSPTPGAVEPTPLVSRGQDSSVPQPNPLHYEACRVEAISVWQQYANSRYGMTEKANGERCLIFLDGATLTASNRLGTSIPLVPQAAQALTALGKSCVIDGERLVGERQGQYAMFDLLHWNGEDLRGWPFVRRIALLQEVLCGHRLIKEAVATPTLEEASHNSLVPGLLLLFPVKGLTPMKSVVEAVRAAEGEGIILRELAAPYVAPHAVLKYKFTADLDAVMIGIKPGPGGGSLKLGLRRPSDNAIVPVGHVRSGLTNEDVHDLTDRLLRGERTVLKVEYLPARTVGIALVEGRTSREWIRHDKPAWDCTTDQLGPAKAGLVRQAKGVPGISFPPASAQETPVSAVSVSPVASPPAQTSVEGQERAASRLPTPPRGPETSPDSLPTASERRARPAPESTPNPQAVPLPEARRASKGSEPPSPVLTPGILMTLHLTTEQTCTMLSRVLEQEKTIIVDVRSKKLLKSARQDLDPHTLRTQWGMRYLSLGSSLADEDDHLTGLHPVRLIKPSGGIAAIHTLLAQGYRMLLICSCPSAHAHLAEIVRLLRQAAPVNWLAAAQFLTEVQTASQEAVVLTR